MNLETAQRIELSEKITAYLTNDGFVILADTDGDTIILLDEEIERLATLLTQKAITL